ncbi:hypothetical protein EW146_g5192 [Bondarzewia mesenterica]|uniref:Oxidized purine nucleoside triphosphate hydrolase n=1 Tax=Bondarzewia mesenterica TaxID=1095465 RepID=A0A4S4LS72_9AGAM|nr:hypothetical protein EW146_g5192 [Bondarzewia mesenterica]
MGIASLPPGLEGNFIEVSSGGGSSWLAFNTKRLYTNAFIIQDDKILLGYKKRGFGVHKYNGFGGKVEQGETAVQAAARELQEEAGITAPLEHYGTFLFVTEGGPDWAFQIEIFRAEEYSGTLIETDEMRFQWFATPNVGVGIPETTVVSAAAQAVVELLPIPFDSMWESDRYWIPLLLSKRHFIGRTDFKSVGETFTLEKWWFGEIGAREW